ncbi:MAG: hypothetical protein ACHBN1_17680 [Heteroscytonema crispum UTEX LB 1556]
MVGGWCNNQPNGRTSYLRECTKSAVRASPPTTNDPSGEPVLGGKPGAQYALHHQPPTTNNQPPTRSRFTSTRRETRSAVRASPPTTNKQLKIKSTSKQVYADVCHSPTARTTNARCNSVVK